MDNALRTLALYLVCALVLVLLVPDGWGIWAAGLLLFVLAVWALVENKDQP